MFGRHFGRRRREVEWDEEDAMSMPHEHGPRQHGHGGHRRDYGPRAFGPHWGRRFGRGGEAERWFAPPHHGRGGPPWGRGGPFGDDPFGEEGGGRRRQRRGDIKYVLMELLAEQPRHGYELIKELESRYAGFYRPSPGSVYPTLQMLEDEGHLTSSPVDGKRVYSVTESGRQFLKERHERAADEREGFGPRGFRPGHMGPELVKLRDSSAALMSSLMQVARHGTPEQVRAAQALIDSARREIYGLLAAGEADQDREQS